MGEQDQPQCRCFADPMPPKDHGARENLVPHSSRTHFHYYFFQLRGKGFCSRRERFCNPSTTWPSASAG